MQDTETTFLPYSRPDTGAEEIEAVSRAIASGWVTTGPETAAFEREFADYLGSDCHTLAVNSATAGLHLALEAVGIGPGDEVIVPTMTFTATAEVVRYLGADPVFADCDTATLNIDPDAIAALISPRTKAIIVVHYGGLACDMTPILALADAHGLKVIEDAAHAFPTTYQGALVGTLRSDATIFSFYANKTMTTGEGGLVATRSEDYARRMRIMRLHGIDRDAFGRFQSRTPAWHYQVVAPGFKYNMTDVAAAMGRVQLRRIDAFAARRAQLADIYRDALADLPLILPAYAPGGDRHAWHIYAIRHRDGPGRPEWRDTFINGLAADGIGTSVHYIPLHRQPFWRDRYGLDAASFPRADAAFASLVSLPLYTAMTDDDTARVIASVRRHVGA
jgi:dTDP-4-amino-4,6-dideoxygalactose transaminase